MLTNSDITKLVSVLASKKDLVDLREDVSLLRETTQGLTTAIEGLASAVDDLRVEYTAVKDQLNRHERSLGPQTTSNQKIGPPATTVRVFSMPPARSWPNTESITSPAISASIGNKPIY
ncbi:MAG: hypothetical protein A3G59_02460 [Candidatus Taylorbacteria bacterium RIFCSPLOWO2_12_FULL_47_20]|uniref:Uncharacterized protein n=2 Tax=Candidatus Tayloriibacteriota TaxID=1817919 RepID=A0A1G2P9Z0_9BACT|nr:MAG: hypothetical protein A3H68_00230 [Candidatus Taylorbacteria bacterium RIFCSPLOWO2_02_FULL_46_40]OHA44539.1 MAG: hypothetical protein A3G59_02460 [Candidatus Taylorbacteria bacterium RIFCSPLOWO2_12_FULL_47_20]